MCLAEMWGKVTSALQSGWGWNPGGPPGLCWLRRGSFSWIMGESGGFNTTRPPVTPPGQVGEGAPRDCFPQGHHGRGRPHYCWAVITFLSLKEAFSDGIPAEREKSLAQLARVRVQAIPTEGAEDLFTGPVRMKGSIPHSKHSATTIIRSSICLSSANHPFYSSRCHVIIYALTASLPFV